MTISTLQDKNPLNKNVSQKRKIFLFFDFALFQFLQIGGES